MLWSGEKWSKVEVNGAKTPQREASGVTGQYQHSIDSKGRLFIPAKLREELGETFYVTMGVDRCLSVYSEDSWNHFTEKFESMPYTKSRAMRPLFANAAKCEPDAQGRILLPAKLRNLCGTEKGCHRHRCFQPRGDLGCSGMDGRKRTRNSAPRIWLRSWKSLASNHQKRKQESRSFPRLARLEDALCRN
jgi:MraZ protein